MENSGSLLDRYRLPFVSSPTMEASSKVGGTMAIFREYTDSQTVAGSGSAMGLLPFPRECRLLRVRFILTCGWCPESEVR
jgi:hypothetical protein